MAERRVQRRLAAILVVDVVGYSRMMGQDEAGTLARLKTLRKEIWVFVESSG
jgi:class 3 adenylate cyclase